MKRVIVVGSPRSNGRSAHLAEMLFEANIDEHPEDELFLVPVSEVEIGPCIGCNACREKMAVTFKDDEGAEVVEQRHRCVFDDDMQALYDLLDEADEVSVVSPVYFSGAPSQMKCVLDRLQPYFWRRVEMRANGALPEKRPLSLHVVGEGGDPHGHDALVSEVKSAFATADFRLERVLDWVGKISEDGEIIAEAAVTQLAGAPIEAAQDEPQGSTQGEAPEAARTAQSRQAHERPRLDLSDGKGKQRRAHQKGGSGRGNAGDGAGGNGRNAGNAGGKGRGNAGNNSRNAGNAGGGNRNAGRGGAKAKGPGKKKGPRRG